MGLGTRECDKDRERFIPDLESCFFEEGAEEPLEVLGIRRTVKGRLEGQRHLSPKVSPQFVTVSFPGSGSMR